MEEGDHMRGWELALEIRNLRRTLVLERVARILASAINAALNRPSTGGGR